MKILLFCLLLILRLFFFFVLLRGWREGEGEVEGLLQLA